GQQARQVGIVGFLNGLRGQRLGYCKKVLPAGVIVIFVGNHLLILHIPQRFIHALPFVLGNFSERIRLKKRLFHAAGRFLRLRQRDRKFVLPNRQTVVGRFCQRRLLLGIFGLSNGVRAFPFRSLCLFNG